MSNSLPNRTRPPRPPKKPVKIAQSTSQPPLVSKPASCKFSNARAILRAKHSQLLLQHKPQVRLAVQSDIEGLKTLVLRLILQRARLRVVTFDEIGHLFITKTGLKRGFAAMGVGSIKHFCVRRLKPTLEELGLVVTDQGVGSKPVSSNPTQNQLRKPPETSASFVFRIRPSERPRPIFSLEWDAEDEPGGWLKNDDAEPEKKRRVDDEDKHKLLTAVLTPYFSLRKILSTFDTQLDIWPIQQTTTIAGAKPHFPWPKWNLLFLAVWTGNIGACEAISDFLAQRNPDNSYINSLNHHHQSLLHIACLRSEETVTEWLLSSKANPNSKNIGRGNQTPLHLAAMKGNVVCVRALLKARADINAVADNGQGPCSALQLAIRSGHGAVVQVLLDHNAVDQPENGCTALERALLVGNDNATMAVFRSSRNVDNSVITEVINANCLKLVHVLFEHSQNQSFWLSALDQAVKCGHLEIVKALLSYMPTPSISISSALATALSHGLTNIAACFLEHQIPLPIPIGPPLLACVRSGRLTYALAQLLVGANCGFEEIDCALHHLVIQEPPDTELVVFLCERYPQMLNQENDVGYNPLHEAVRAKAGEMLTLLISLGADVNSRNFSREGLTPLHLAAARGWTSGIKELVRAGADINCKKLSWKPPRTAVGIATKSGFDHAVTALMELGANAEGFAGRKLAVEFNDQEPESLSKWMYVSQDERAAKNRERSVQDVQASQADSVAYQGSWKVVRIFISSTFRDMHAERNFLVSQVLPALRKKCQERKLHLVDIDLRWGVTEAEAQSGESVELCLREVNNCNLFISLLGGRYGWVPGPNEARFRYPVAASNELSITAMEVEQALSRGPDVDCFFLIRDSSLEASIPPPYSADFTETEETPRSLLADLKQRVRTSKSPVTEYTATFKSVDDGQISLEGLETVGEALSAQLWAAIDRRYPLTAAQVAPFDVETNYHKDFVQSKSNSFVGRSEVIAKLLQYAYSSGGKPLVVTGNAGSGKSALMGYFAQHAYRETRNTVVIVHSVGASPSSTNIHDTIWHLCSAIIHEFAFWDKVPSEYHERVQLFKELLQRIPQTKRKLLIVFDALNQLDHTNRSHSLSWLPSELPAEVGIIVSCLEGDCLEILRRRGTTEFKLEGFSNSERAEMVTRLLGSYQKKLDASQMECLLSKADAMHPLYLVAACEELRVFGVYEKLTSKIQTLEPTIQGIFTQALQRLELQHGEACKRLLSFLFLSRHGLMETELFELVELPPSRFAALLMSLQMFLRVVGKSDEGYLDFFHRQFAKAVETRYLQPTTKQQFHFELAAFHRNRADPQLDESWVGGSSRAFQSLPYHLLHSGDPDLLVPLLSDLQFVQAKCEHGLIHDLISDYMLAEEAAETETQFHALSPFKRFLVENVHILELHCNLMYQQATLSCSEEVREAAGRLRNQSSIVCTNYVEPVRDFFASMVGPERVNVVHYSPNGKTLLVGYFDGSLILWNAVTYSRIAIVVSTRGRITDACFSPTGELVAAASGLGVDIYQTSSLDLLHTLLAQEGSHSDEVLCCAFSPSGNYLVSGGADRRLVMWNWAHESVMSSLVLSKQEEVVESTSAALSSSVALQGVSREVVQGSIVSCSIGADSKTVVCGSANKLVYVLEIESASITLKHTLAAHTKCVNHVAISRDCDVIASVGQDRALIVWQVATGTVLWSIKSHTENVACVNFSPTGRFLVTASWDKTLKVYSCFTPGLKHDWVEMGTLRGHAHYCNYADFSPTEHCIVSGSVDMTVSTYNFSGVLPPQQARAEAGHGDLIRSLQYCPARDVVITSSWDHQVKLFTRAGTQLWAMTASSKRVNSVDVSASGQLIATGASDCTARVWEFDSRQEVLVFEGHTEAVFAVVFSHDMQYLATGSCDKTIIIWSLETAGKVSHLIGHEDWVMALHFSMFSRRLVSGCQSGQVKVWDVIRQTNITTLPAHTGAVLACLFTPCEQKIVSASVDKLIKVWDATYYTPLLTIQAHSNEVTCLAFITSPSLPLSVESRMNCVTTHVVSGSSDKSLVISDILTGAYVRSYHGSGAVMSLSAIDSSHFALGDSLGVFSLLEVQTDATDMVEHEEEYETKEHEEEYETKEPLTVDWVCGEILSVEPIYRTKLQVCQIEIGEGIPLQVVTSAPNVRVGHKVVVAPVGAVVREGNREIVIELSRLGGRSSEGMLLGCDTLGWEEEDPSFAAIASGMHVGERLQPPPS